MARPTNNDRKLEIALGAFEVIRERGAHRTTMSDIAAALEMKRPTLYFHFPNLSAIFEAVLEHTLAELQALRQSQMAGISHPIDLIDAHIGAVRDYFAERQDFIVVMFQLWAAGSEPGPDSVFRRTSAHFDALREGTAELLRQGIEAGFVAPCDPDVLVDLVGAFVDGCLVHGIARGIDTGPMHDLFRAQVLTPLRRHPSPQTSE